MSDKSFTYKLVKYLLIAKICVGIVFSFIVLFLFVFMTSHHSSDGKTTGIPAEDDMFYYHHNDSKSMDKSMLGIVISFIAIEIVIQMVGLMGAIRANVILLLIFGVLVSLAALFEFVAIFTYDGNALFLIYFTFLAVLVFVYIYIVKNERRTLPRVHYIPAPTNPYSYSYFPQPNHNSLLFKDNQEV